MAAPIIAGNSANITLDLATSTNWGLNCLDNNNQVLESVNVTLLADGVASEVNITLPEIISLNNRKVEININTADFGGTITFNAGSVKNFVNGVADITATVLKNTSLPVVALSSQAWTIPAFLTEAP